MYLEFSRTLLLLAIVRVMFVYATHRCIRHKWMHLRSRCDTSLQPYKEKSWHVGGIRNLPSIVQKISCDFWPKRRVPAGQLR